jgi:hypothetical protein
LLVPNSLALVFRGTDFSAKKEGTRDVLFDLAAVPVPCGSSGVFMHGGFLLALAGCLDELKSAFDIHLRRDTDLTICGHSLGGALALTLVGTGTFKDHIGDISVIMVGSPMVFCGNVPTAEDLGIDMLLLLVNEADCVPRLLGSNKALFAGVMKVLCPDIRPEKKKDLEAFLEIVELFKHPEGLELVVGSPGRMLHIPKAEHKHWLCLDACAASLSLKKLGTDHFIDKYVELFMNSLLKDMDCPQQ